MAKPQSTKCHTLATVWKEKDKFKKLEVVVVASALDDM